MRQLIALPPPLPCSANESSILFLAGGLTATCVPASNGVLGGEGRGEYSVRMTALSNYCHIRRQRDKLPSACGPLWKYRGSCFVGFLWLVGLGCLMGHLGVRTHLSPNKLYSCHDDKDTASHVFV